MPNNPTRYLLVEEFPRVGPDHDRAYCELLDKAAAQGYTDLVFPFSTNLALRLEGLSWTIKSKTGTVGITKAVHNEDQTCLIVHRVPRGGITPAQWAESLEEFKKEVPSYWSPQHLITTLLREPVKGYSLAYQLPENVSEAVFPEGLGTVLKPQRAGLSLMEEKDLDRPFLKVDKNKAHLSAIKQAAYAPLAKGEVYEHWGTNAPLPGRAWAGLYKLEVPLWKGPLPSPFGLGAEAGEVLWADNNLMTLFQELGLSLSIQEAWLAPRHSAASVKHYTQAIEAWLAKFEGTPTELIPKDSYQSFSGLLSSTLYRGHKYYLYRPDVGNSVKTTSWANVYRKAMKVYEADSRFVPQVINVDSLAYDAALGLPPNLTLGPGLGGFKIEGPLKEHYGIYGGWA